MDLIEYYVHYLVDYFVLDFVEIDYAFEMSATDYYYVLASILEKPTKKVNINEVF
jgi:hypothetical protein